MSGYVSAEGLLKPSKRCPDCEGLGFQAGAHTERVEPCPRCKGSGKA